MASIIGVETLQHTNGTTAATIDSSGRISTPERPFIDLRGNNASRVTNGGTHEVYTDWSVETSKGITYNTSNGRLTVPIAGLYLVTPKFYFWMNDASNHWVQLRINGTNKFEFVFEFDEQRSGDAQHDNTVGHAVILNLSANDYIDFNCNADIYGGSVHTSCQMALL